MTPRAAMNSVLRNRIWIATLLAFFVLMLAAAPAVADGTAPPPPPDNTTTYLYNIGGYWIAMTPLQYFINTWGYDVCVALFWC